MFNEDPKKPKTSAYWKSYVLPGVLAPTVAFRPKIHAERERLSLVSSLSPETRSFWMRLSFVPGAILLFAAGAVGLYGPSWLAVWLLAFGFVAGLSLPVGFALAYENAKKLTATVVLHESGPIVVVPGEPPRLFAACRLRLVNISVGTGESGKTYQQLQCEVLHETGYRWVHLMSFYSILNERFARALADRWNVTLEVIASPFSTINLTTEEWSILNKLAPDFPRVVNVDDPAYTNSP